MKIVDIVLILVGILAVGGLIYTAWGSHIVPPKVDVPPTPTVKQPTAKPITPSHIIPDNIPIIPPVEVSVPKPIVQTPEDNIPIKGNIPKINIQDITANAGQINISETIMQDSTPLLDAECELDIINNKGVKVVDFRSFYNNDGLMEYSWDNATPGKYILSQYCWHGDTLDLNKIYSNSTITVE